MNKIKRTSVCRIAVIFAVLAAILFASCYTPSPLYGTWADNNGNKLTFINDGTFVAKISVTGNIDAAKNYEGDWTMIDNVIVFSTTTGLTINTEWDLRGSILYLTWTSDGITKNLSLYHTSK